MEQVWQDLRYALRTMAKSPGFTAVAVLTLALGIGANTAIFTIINSVFLNPLPVHRGDQLVDLYTTDPKNNQGNFSLFPMSFRNYEDFRDQSDAFSGLAASTFAPATMTGKGDPKQFTAVLATANYFDVLGVRAVRGRTFLPDEDAKPGGNNVAVISYSIWSREFGSDPGLIGQTITLNSQPFTVIGVAPPQFKGTALLASPDAIWVPWSMYRQVMTGPLAGFILDRRALFFSVVGRLKSGIGLPEAEANLKTIAAGLEKEYPKDNEGRSVRLVPTLQAAIGAFPGQGANQGRQFTLAGGMLMTIVAVVLLIACVNLANLLLSRAAVREKEMGIRAALGAARSRLLRQLLTESVVLAVLGGVAGLLVAFWGRDLLWSFRPPFLPDDATSLQLDGTVLAFTAGVSLLTGLLFGLVPAIRASAPDLNEALKVSGRGGVLGWGRSKLRSLLVVAEVALALVALVGAGLFVRSLQNAQRFDPGFESEKLFVLGFNIGSRNVTPEQGQQFYEQAIAEARKVPGVVNAAVASNLPVGGGFLRTTLPEGRSSEAGERGVLMTVNSVSTDYFDTLQIPLLRGRLFTEFDREDAAPVAVINEAVARRLWPDQDPIGKRFHFFGDDVMREVVGIARNVLVVQVGEDPQPVIYQPLRQSYSPFAALQVRTSGPPEEILPTVRQKVQELDRKLAIAPVRTIGEIFNQALWAPRMGAALLSLFALLALALAAIGIYGVMAQSVTQRRQEIGLRMALGAQRSDISRLVIRQGMLLAGIGMAFGLAAAFAATRVVASLLYDLSATDPITFGGVALLLALVALVACWVPAFRATRVDPIVTLRYE